jgi:hypothetical protein
LPTMNRCLSVHFAAARNHFGHHSFEFLSSDLIGQFVDRIRRYDFTMNNPILSCFLISSLFLSGLQVVASHETLWTGISAVVLISSYLAVAQLRKACDCRVHGRKAAHVTCSPSNEAARNAVASTSGSHFRSCSMTRRSTALHIRNNTIPTQYSICSEDSAMVRPGLDSLKHPSMATTGWKLIAERTRRHRLRIG